MPADDRVSLNLSRACGESIRSLCGHSDGIFFESTGATSVTASLAGRGALINTDINEELLSFATDSKNIHSRHSAIASQFNNRVDVECEGRNLDRNGSCRIAVIAHLTGAIQSPAINAS